MSLRTCQLTTKFGWTCRIFASSHHIVRQLVRVWRKSVKVTPSWNLILSSISIETSLSPRAQSHWNTRQVDKGFWCWLWFPNGYPTDYTIFWYQYLNAWRRVSSNNYSTASCLLSTSPSLNFAEIFALPINCRLSSILSIALKCQIQEPRPALIGFVNILPF